MGFSIKYNYRLENKYNHLEEKAKMAVSVTRYGKPLSKELCNWNEKTRTFSTKESNLVIDFSLFNYVTFITGPGCVFKTGAYCNFRTGSGCVFRTGHNCTFESGSDCVFKTSSHCTFETGSNCTFDVSSSCTFKTGPRCAFFRRDVFELSEIPEGQKIKLNVFQDRGYEVVEKKYTIIIKNDECIELSKKEFLDLKKQLNDIVS